MNAIMSDLDFQRGNEPVQERWQGLSELDRALAENRLTAYRWQKAWADPINRLVMILVFSILAACVGFIVVTDFIIGH